MCCQVLITSQRAGVRAAVSSWDGGKEQVGREREKQQPPGQGARGEAGIWSWELGSGIWMRMWEMGRREQATGNRGKGGIWTWGKGEREGCGCGKRGKGSGMDRGEGGKGMDMRKEGEEGTWEQGNRGDMDMGKGGEGGIQLGNWGRRRKAGTSQGHRAGAASGVHLRAGFGFGALSRRRDEPSLTPPAPPTRCQSATPTMHRAAPRGPRHLLWGKA